MTQRYTIRSFRAPDIEYEAIVRVFNLANPHEPGTVATWQHRDQHRDRAKVFTRYVVDRDGEIGGYGFSFRTDVAANMFRFDTHYLPEWKSAELVARFGRYVTDQCLEIQATALITRVVEDDSIKMAWLRSEGFRPVMRYLRSTLDVVAFDTLAYAELKARIAQQGIEISLADLARRDSVWQRRAYDLKMLLVQDVPSPSEFTPPPFEEYAQTQFEAPDFIPELWLVALDGDTCVGMTSLFRLGDNLEMLDTSLTGVRRDYRRRGLAMALKCQAIEAAQQMGVRQIQASNEENNPMFHLNLQLGFEAQPAVVDWEKMFDGES